jgi:hypothetical protein
MSLARQAHATAQLPQPLQVVAVEGDMPAGADTAHQQLAAGPDVERRRQPTRVQLPVAEAAARPDRSRKPGRAGLCE